MDTRLRAELRKKRTVLRLDLWSRLTRPHQALFYAALLELNSILQLKTLRSSLTVNPTNAPELSRKQEPEQLENRIQRTEGKEPVSGLSTLFNVGLTWFLSVCKGPR